MRSFQNAASSLARLGGLSASLGAASVLSYGAALPWLRRLCASPLMQATVFARRLSHLQNVDRPGGPAVDRAVARTRCLLKWMGGRWRLLDLGREGSDRFPWLTIQGLEHFEEASRRGPVVLLSSHFGAPRLSVVLLAKRRHRLMSLEAWGKQYRGIDRRLTSRIEVQFLRGKSAFPARSTLAARRRLRAGGIVHTTGDGQVGRADALVPFCGRTQAFRSTFAALAVDACATVIPVFAPVDEGGRVRLEFLRPLDPGPSSASRRDRIDALLRQYVGELERRWLTDPGNVNRFLWAKNVVPGVPALDS